VPTPATVSVPTVVIAAGAMLAMLRFKVGMGRTLAVSAVLGVVFKLVFP
jgi:chromate transporter